MFGGDGPTQFKTKLDVVVREAKIAMARAQFIKANNRPWNSIPARSNAEHHSAARGQI